MKSTSPTEHGGGTTVQFIPFNIPDPDLALTWVSMIFYLDDCECWAICTCPDIFEPKENFS